MSYDKDEKIVQDVYDSVIDNFGVDFSSNSNGYYPNRGKKHYLKNTQFMEKELVLKVMKIGDIYIYMKKIIHVEEAGFVNFAKKRCVKVKNIRTNQ